MYIIVRSKVTVKPPQSIWFLGSTLFFSFLIDKLTESLWKCFTMILLGPRPGDELRKNINNITFSLWKWILEKYRLIISPPKKEITQEICIYNIISKFICNFHFFVMIWNIFPKSIFIMKNNICDIDIFLNPSPDRGESCLNNFRTIPLV